MGDAEDQLNPEERLTLARWVCAPKRSAETLSRNAQPRSFPRSSSLSCAGFALPPVAFMT
jgi:hypothetical protein